MTSAPPPPPIPGSGYSTLLPLLRGAGTPEAQRCSLGTSGIHSATMAQKERGFEEEGLCPLCRVKESSSNIFLSKDLEKMTRTGYKSYHCVPDLSRVL